MTGDEVLVCLLGIAVLAKAWDAIAWWRERR
jgi:hypothetical protein